MKTNPHPTFIQHNSFDGYVLVCYIILIGVVRLFVVRGHFLIIRNYGNKETKCVEIIKNFCNKNFHIVNLVPSYSLIDSHLFSVSEQ